MDIFIYSDESGVFDSKHNDIFVFAGIICFGKEQKDAFCKYYSSIEKIIRTNKHFSLDTELKASILPKNTKNDIYRSFNNSFKFAVIIKEKFLNQNVFSDKKHKQRYLDYAYKLVLKKTFSTMIKNKCLDPKVVKHIYVNCDQHTTATDGIYELKENLRNEFKRGTFSMTYNVFYEPIFTNLEDLDVNYCDSKKVALIRVADIIANHIYYEATNKNTIKRKKGLFLLSLPSNIIVCNGLDLFNK